jgi:hypothetical protein
MTRIRYGTSLETLVHQGESSLVEHVFVGEERKTFVEYFARNLLNISATGGLSRVEP